MAKPGTSQTSEHLSLYLLVYKDKNAQDVTLLPPESLFIIYLSSFLAHSSNISENERNPITIFFITENKDENQEQYLNLISLKIQFLQSILQQRNIVIHIKATKHSTESCHWLLESCTKFPLLLDDKYSAHVGVANVSRKLIRYINSNNGTLCTSSLHLLGYRGSCLRACSEVSLMTRICEEELPNQFLTFYSTLSKTFDKSTDLDLTWPPALSELNDLLAKPLRKAGMKVKSCASLSNRQRKYFESDTDITLVDLIVLTHLLPLYWLQPVARMNIFENIRDFHNLYLWFQDIMMLHSVERSVEEVEACFSYDRRRDMPQVLGNTHISLTENGVDMNMSVKKPTSLQLKQALTHVQTHETRRFQCCDTCFTTDGSAQTQAEALDLKQNRELKKRLQVDCILKWCHYLLQSGGDGDAKVMSCHDDDHHHSRTSGQNLHHQPSTPLIVDYCSGTSHVALRLARAFPKYRVVAIENKEKSFDLAKERALAEGLTNIYHIQSNIRHLTLPLTLGVALHACGSVTDLVLASCAQASAHVCVVPCCYGSISSRSSHIIYPQSHMYKARGVTLKDMLVVGHAADQTEINITKQEQGQYCMNVIDTDRLASLLPHYDLLLTRLKPSISTTKNNVLLAKHISPQKQTHISPQKQTHISPQKQTDR